MKPQLTSGKWSFSWGFPFPNATVTGWWHQVHILYREFVQRTSRIPTLNGKGESWTKIWTTIFTQEVFPWNIRRKNKNNPKIPGLQISPKRPQTIFGMKCGMTVMEKKQGIDLKMFPTKPYTVEDGKLCSCLGMILKGFPPHASWDLPIHQPERNLLPQSSRGCGGWTIFILKFGLKIILSTNHQLWIARFSPPWTHLFLCPLHLPCWRTHSCPDSKSPRESGRPDAINSAPYISSQHQDCDISIGSGSLWAFSFHYGFRATSSTHLLPSIWKCAAKSGKSTGAFCYGSLPAFTHPLSAEMSQQNISDVSPTVT